MIADIAHRARYALSILQPRALALRPFRCPLCGPSVVVRLSRDPIGVRCVRCGASAITMAHVATLRVVRPGFRSERVYELSSRGPLFEFLRREIEDFTFSEYFDDTAPGAWRDRVQCQDVQRLTYPDACFDVCTSTEVFEHVPDDALGFAEIARVLKPGGLFVFTVPLDPSTPTRQRAIFEGGIVRHVLEPAYHDDRIRGRGRVLVFRDYGSDIVDRLFARGFARAWIESRFAGAFLGFGAFVLVAER